MKAFEAKRGTVKQKKFFALSAQRKGTIESFLSKKRYNKVKFEFALRAQRRGTIESFLSKNGYSKMKNYSKFLNQMYVKFLI